MGKLKTKKTLSKRIKITGTGKLMRKKIQTGHLKVKVSNSAKFRKKRSLEVSKSYQKTLKSLLPKV